MNLIILKEKAQWIAVSKPAGIQVERNPFGPSVESLVYDHLSRKQNNPYVGVVHRIDRPTSGVVIIAKRKSALKRLNLQFSRQGVQKQYLARVAPVPATTKGELEHWLEKSMELRKAIVHTEEIPKAKYCALAYEQLDNFSDEQALLRVHPKTGRYHQIRAQLSAIGCPIVGDDKYGSVVAYEENRIMLHAWKLHIPSLKIKVETEMPEWAGRKD